MVNGMAKKADHGEIYSARLATPISRKIKRIIRSKTNSSHPYSASDAMREAAELLIQKYAGVAS